MVFFCLACTIDTLVATLRGKENNSSMQLLHCCCLHIRATFFWSSRALTVNKY